MFKGGRASHYAGNEESAFVIPSDQRYHHVWSVAELLEAVGAAIIMDVWAFRALVFCGAFLCLPVAMCIVTLRMAGVIAQRWSIFLLVCLAIATAILFGIFVATQP